MPSTSQDASIAAELRDDILRGHYRCGERLPSERDLAGRFGVHRSTIREAFKRLEQLGVASIHPGGARVAPLEEASLDVVEHLLALDNPPDPEILDQALEAMSGFRAMAARLGTERADPSQRARMLSILGVMMEADFEQSDAGELVEELSTCLVEASSNMVLKLMQHGLRARQSRSLGAPDLLRATPDKDEAEPHLRRLSSAIEKSDGATASEAVYNLSCLYRQTVLRQSGEVEEAAAPEMRAAQGGAQS
jgi:DNA-binding FadR family transcriptional regulator